MSMADLSNNSSASITANMLAIKSHVFVQQDHQQPRLIPVVVPPIYQLSTPMSSTNSLSTPSRSVSPAHQLLDKGPSLQIAGTVTEIESLSTDNVNNHRLVIPTKDELQPGQNGAMKNANAKSRSGKGHSSNSSSCSWTSTLAQPSIDEVDSGKDSQALPPAPVSSPAPAPPTSQRSHHHHDHSLSSVFDDIRSKTQNVLRKVGFSIAPEAGLFADRGSTKPADLKVIRLFPTSVSLASRPNDRNQSSITLNSKDPNLTGSSSSASVIAVKPTGFFTRPRSRSVRETSRPLLEVDSLLAQQQKQQTSDTTSAASPRSPIVMTSSPISLNQRPNSPPPSTSSSSSLFKFERWPPWNITDRGGGGGHQRSNSGPARPSDWIIRPKRRMTVGLENANANVNDRILDQHTNGSGEHTRTGSGPLPSLPPLPATLVATTTDGGKKKGHQRRVSDATTLTITSTRSAGASPQRFQLQNLQQQQHSYPPNAGTVLPSMPLLQHQAIPEKQQLHTGPKSVMGNLFGMVSKRRSFPSVEEEDPKQRRIGYGGQYQQYNFQGYEVTNIGSQRNSVIVLDDGDEDLDDLEEDTDLEEEEHVSITAPGEEGGRTTPAGNNRIRKERRKQVLVNDYGFICEPESVSNNNSGSDGQHGHGDSPTTTGSMVSELAARLSEPGSFLAEHERKRNLKKQYEFNRSSEVKWIQAITHLQPDQVKKLTKYKKLARGGVPPTIRGRVWQFLANVDHYREPGLFQNLLTRGHLPIHDVIARDVHRCYPDHVHFRDGMGGTGQEDLHSILKAYAHYKPSVGYCQGMGRLVGMMLMQMPVEEAFWLLVATLEGGYLNDYFTPTLRQLRIDALVFERLLKAQDPRLAQHLEANDVSPIMYITPWFLTLFTLSLPWASVLRVWDVFYFDGVKTLFRIGLGILQICRTTLLEECPSSAECMDFLLHVPLDRLGPEVLLDRTAFRIRLRRESLEKMSILTAGEMDAKEARSAIASRAATMTTTTTATGSGSINEKQHQQQCQEDAEGDDKKKNKRTMMGAFRGVKAAATATSGSLSTMTTITTVSTPPTSANSVRTAKSHTATSSRTDIVTIVEPTSATNLATLTTTTTTTTPTTDTFAITTMGSVSKIATSDMNQEVASLLDPDHDENLNKNITNTTNINYNTSNSNLDDYHLSKNSDKNNDHGNDEGDNVTLQGIHREVEKEARIEEMHISTSQPLMFKTPDNKSICSTHPGHNGVCSRPTSRSSMRATTPSPSSPSSSLPPLPPHSPSSASNPVLSMTSLSPKLPATTTSPTSVSPPNNGNNGSHVLSGFSSLGVFKTRKRAGTHV
ncbi:hypothetical protein FBU30_011245 [Linnemannia zychae]|nr:hypothetical protein FBU30_011245 [Linnemannia zychae]